MNSVSGKLILPVVDAVVFIKTNINQSIIAFPGIGVNGTFKVNLAGNDLAQGSQTAIRNHFGVDPTIPLKDAKDGLLMSSPAFFGHSTWYSSWAKVGFINLYLTSKNLSFRNLIPVNCSTKCVKVLVNRIPV
jgi:hypothetical protein